MPKQARNENQIIKAAKEYVSKQIATMKKHGAAPKLSAGAINDLVRQVADATK
jgi:hypothetical protein